MKFYYGEYVNENFSLVQRPIRVKGTIKTTNTANKVRVPIFDTLVVNGYWYDYNLDKWLKTEEMDTDHYFSCFKSTNVPQSAKAFNRYTRKLLERQEFEKGTIIQLSGRFSGIGLFCII